MFDKPNQQNPQKNTEKSPSSFPSSDYKVEDIFSETETLKQKTVTASTSQPVGVSAKSSQLNNNTWIAIAGFFVLTIVLVGTFFVLNKQGVLSDRSVGVDNTGQSDATDIPTPPAEPLTDKLNSGDVTPLKDEVKSSVTVIEEPKNTDTDIDGLTDTEEEQLGTNSKAADSDNDGLNDYEEKFIYFTNPLKNDTDDDSLTDYDEIRNYHTDPLNKDTDGDNYKDGEEAQHGYNPLGPGKLNQ